MYSTSAKLVSRHFTGGVFRSMSTSTTRKVAVLGSTGGIGQPLSMLLKLSPLVDELTCYDIVGSPGVAADLGHICTKTKVSGSLPTNGVSTPAKENAGLAEALTGASVVVIPAGVPRRPGMTRDDLFNINASIVRGLVEGCAEYCPNAVLAIISNPINSTVPIAAEVLKAHGVYDPRKVCGVTTLDAVRAKTFAGDHMGKNPADLDVTVIGGHAGITILPLFSRIPGFSASDEELESLTVRTQFGGDEVVAAKAGDGSATLSMAYAGYVFTEEVIRGLNGEKVTTCAFVESSVTDAPYFASPCEFGPNGVEKILDLGKLTPYEQGWLDKMLPDLKSQIQKGIDFATK